MNDEDTIPSLWPKSPSAYAREILAEGEESDFGVIWTLPESVEELRVM